MKNCDNFRNPLEWGGANQQERLLKALVPDSVQLDDHSIEDLMVFVVRLSEQFNYFNEDNLLDGDWRPFWQKDPLFLIAFIAATDTDGLEDKFRKLESKFWLNRMAYEETEDKSCVEDPCAKDMEAIVQLTLHTARLIGLFWHYSELVPNLRHCLLEMINAELADALRLLIGYDKGSGRPAYWEGQYAEWFNDPVWRLDKAEYECIGFIVPCDDPMESLKILKNDLFAAFVGALVRLRAKARTYLDHYWKDPNSVAGNAAHAPHIALFMAFVQLLEHLKKQMNGLPAKHLDFYYKEILRLEKKSAIPDRVHLVFDLAVNTSRYILEKDAVAKAGKDKIGKDLWYLTEKALAINRSKVAAIRTLYIEDKDSPGGDILRAARVLDSKGEDGAPKDLKSVQPFRPFGDVSNPEVEVGFAIASPQFELGLAEARTIVLSVHIEASSFAKIQGLKLKFNSFKAFISTGKEFMEVTSLSYKIEPVAFTNPLEFTITLDALFPAVVALEDTPGVNMPRSKWPILKILLYKDADKEIYDNFRLVKVERFDIEVKSTNIQDVVVQNGNSFLPTGRKENVDIWGPVAAVNATCRVGSQELFSKKVGNFTLGIDWKQMPAAGSYVSMRYLAGLGPNWLVLTTVPSSPVAIALGPTTYSMNTAIWPVRDPLLRQFNSFENTLSRGFLELNLSTYVPPVVGLPQIFLGDISLGYVSKEAIAINGNPYEEYFHLTPWAGYIRIDLSANHSTIPLLPTFQQPVGPDQASPDPYFTRGNLFIGIKDAEPQETLALLFQIEEGTEENPEARPPEVAWSYWKKDDWQEFPPTSIISNSTRNNQDTQNSLLQSGIIEFKLPPDLNIGANTALDPNLFWIRASVVEFKTAKPPVLVQALPQVVAIRAQAVKAVFQNRENTPEHLAEPLKPETIRQLLQRRVEIQKIEQPFASFGGLPAESDQDFYRRVSERLRHKNRAITPWDYERITLQAFPEIRAARCVPHSNVTSEIAPGSVLLVAMPWLRYRAIQNPLKPKVGVGMLDRIRAYLRSKVSLFVYCCDHLQVVNPIYQEIRVTLCVKFYDGLDNIAHMHLLDEALSQIIAPWAYDDSKLVQFGEPLYVADIVQQIEQLPYVDYLKDAAFDILKASGAFERVQGAAILPDKAFFVMTAYQNPDKTDFETHHQIFIVGEPIGAGKLGCACCGPRTVLPLCCECKQPCRCEEECDDPNYWNAVWIKRHVEKTVGLIAEKHLFEPFKEEVHEKLKKEISLFLETLKSKCTYFSGHSIGPAYLVEINAQEILTEGAFSIKITMHLRGGDTVIIDLNQIGRKGKPLDI